MNQAASDQSQATSKQKQDKEQIKFSQRVFNLEGERLSRGAWWWWFWLFFLDPPQAANSSKDGRGQKPRQLMILWSVKDVRSINCNGQELNFDRKQNYKSTSNNAHHKKNSKRETKLDGAVAAWYFDGNKMHHNYLLEQCPLHINNSCLSSKSTIPTSFSSSQGQNQIKIGDQFELVAEQQKDHELARPSYSQHNFLSQLGFSLIRHNHLQLTGRVNNEPVQGSAYFQRVFVNAPAVPWYWGIFHFENGGLLTYYRPYLLNKSIKENISFYDGDQLHKFSRIKIVREKTSQQPQFKVKGINRPGSKRIEFTVNSYSHSCWDFRRDLAGLMPTRLTYNEYPAEISELRLKYQSGSSITLDDLGSSVGNAEHNKGFLP